MYANDIVTYSACKHLLRMSSQYGAEENKAMIIRAKGEKICVSA